MAIRDWHENDRLREKPLKFGEISLSGGDVFINLSACANYLHLYIGNGGHFESLQQKGET